MEIPWIFFSIVVIIGSMAIFLSERYGHHKSLSLIISGMLVAILTSNMFFYVNPWINFLIASLAFIFIILDSASKIRFLHIDTIWKKTAIFLLLCLMLNVSFLSLFSFLLFDFGELPIVMMLSIMLALSSNDLSSYLSNKAVKNVLEVEAIISSLGVTLLIFSMMQLREGAREGFNGIIGALALGFSIGLLLYFIFARLKVHSFMLKMLGLLCCFFISWLFGFEPWISVIIAAMMIGNFHHKGKPAPKYLVEFMEVALFIVLGAMIYLSPPTFTQVISAVLLFIVYIAIRYVAAIASFHDFSQNEKFMIAVSSSKGLVLSAIVLLFFSFKMADGDLLGISKVLNVAIIFMILSLVLSIIIVKYQRHLTA